MRENRSYGSEGGEPQLNAAFLPLSLKSDCIAIPISVKIYSCHTFLTIPDPSIRRGDRQWSSVQADY